MSGGAPVLRGCDVLQPQAPAKVAKPKRSAKSAKGRFGVLNTFVDVTLRELDRTAGLVWVILWRDTRDGRARTGQADIARRIGCSARTVRSAVKRLEACGLLTVVFRGGLNRGPSIYRMRAVSESVNDGGARRKRASG